MKEAFRDISFKRNTHQMIHLVNEIIESLAAMGYKLTLRQLYCQLVSRDVLPNRQSEYKRLGSILNDARLAGLVDWNAIEDRTRSLKGMAHWDEPSDIIRSAAHSFHIDKWKNQDVRLEVWVEKDALVGVLAKACNALDVPFFSCRGYTSQTALYDAGKRILRYISEGKKPVIIHLGDHDPSGTDMTRDVTERFEMFTGEAIEVERIALNMDQIRRYNPPPNPAKSTDSRFAGYRRKHGLNSWELDALDPQVIDKLITDTILGYRNDDQWESDELHEARQVELLNNCSTNWDKVVKTLTKKPRKKKK